MKPSPDRPAAREHPPRTWANSQVEVAIGGCGGVRKGCGPWRLLGNVAHWRGKGVLKFPLRIHSQVPGAAGKCSPHSGTLERCSLQSWLFSTIWAGPQGRPVGAGPTLKASGKCSTSLACWGRGGESLKGSSRLQGGGV